MPFQDLHMRLMKWKGRFRTDALRPKLVQLLNGGAISYPGLQVPRQQVGDTMLVSQGPEQRE